MINFKRKIIHFLGGFTFDDFTPIQQAEILQMQAQNAMDRQAMLRLLGDIGMPSYTFEPKNVLRGTIMEVPTPEGWKCPQDGCQHDYFHQHENGALKTN